MAGANEWRIRKEYPQEAAGTSGRAGNNANPHSQEPGYRKAPAGVKLHGAIL
jgi:hypothetical protein